MASQIRKDFILDSATDDSSIGDGPFRYMPAADRVRLLQGQQVELVAVLPDGQQVPLGKEYLQLLRAAWTVLRNQLDNIAGPGLYVREITHLLVPVLSAAALRMIMTSVRHGLQKKQGALPEIPHQDGTSLYKHTAIRQAATAIGFGYIVPQMKKYIEKTRYRGDDHRYKSPVDDIKLIYGSPVNQAMTEAKNQLVEWLVKAELDKNLTNRKAVNACMWEIPEFANAVVVEEAREKAFRNSPNYRAKKIKQAKKDSKRN
ncbi:hypothetical protein PMZ80_005071 [Knufia obscura]|uniref:Uncharacterized protein n=1 Tax=Knufia obscura TaxID=1635080 RepID=A0ABR0RPH7_9EURO|nr:hypothetical protein PMZ80_005071 [Knufia obscura]